MMPRSKVVKGHSRWLREIVGSQERFSHVMWGMTYNTLMGIEQLEDRDRHIDDLLVSQSHDHQHSTKITT